MINSVLAWLQANPVLALLIAFYAYRFWKSRQPMSRSKVVKIKSKAEYDVFIADGVAIVDYFANGVLLPHGGAHFCEAFHGRKVRLGRQVWQS